MWMADRKEKFGQWPQQEFNEGFSKSLNESLSTPLCPIIDFPALTILRTAKWLLAGSSAPTKTERSTRKMPASATWSGKPVNLFYVFERTRESSATLLPTQALKLLLLTATLPVNSLTHDTARHPSWKKKHGTQFPLIPPLSCKVEENSKKQRSESRFIGEWHKTCPGHIPVTFYNFQFSILFLAEAVFASGWSWWIEWRLLISHPIVISS